MTATGKVSVIVPIYNAMPYLEECLKSLENQTYQNLEFVLIDDGSTDESSLPAKEFAKKHANAVYIHKANGGVSAARNDGMEAASGQYVAFVDADDYLEKDYVSKLMEKMQPKGLAGCAYTRIRHQEMNKNHANNRNQKKDVKRDKDLDRKSAKKDAVPLNRLSRDCLIEKVLCDNRIGGYLWNKLFDLSLIKEKGILFDKELSIGEDMLFIVTYLQYIKEGEILSEALYFYRENQASALKKMETTRQFDKKKLCTLKAVKKIEEISLFQYAVSKEKEKELKQQEKTSDMVRKAVFYRIARTSMWVLFQMTSCSYYEKELVKTLADNLRRTRTVYLKSQYAKGLEKFVAVVFCICPHLLVKVLGGLYKSPLRKISKKYLN